MTHEREDHLLDDWLDVRLHKLPAECMAYTTKQIRICRNFYPAQSVVLFKTLLFIYFHTLMFAGVTTGSSTQSGKASGHSPPPPPLPPHTPFPPSPSRKLRFVSFSGMNFRALNQVFLINQELYHLCVRSEGFGMTRRLIKALLVAFV